MLAQGFIRIMVGFVLLLLLTDVVKTVFPFTCSSPGHYHFVKYTDISGSASSSVRWSSGRSVTSYSGGKENCKLSSVWGAIYSLPIGLFAAVMSIPAAPFEFLIPISILAIMVRIAVSVAVFAIFSKSIYFYIKSGKLMWPSDIYHSWKDILIMRMTESSQER